MDAVSTLAEAYADAIKIGNRAWDIFRNPTLKEYNEALGDNGEVRAFLVDNDILVWNVYGAVHRSVRDFMKLPHETIIPLVIFGRPGQRCIALVSDHAQNTMWAHNGAVVAAIQNHPYMRRMFREVEVTFYDQDIVGDWRELNEALDEGARVNWTPIPGDGYRTVLADVRKLDASLAKDQGMYVGRGGEGGVKGRYGRFQDYLQSGAPVEQPRMSIGPYGEAVVGNGRHRFAVLRDQGLQTIPVSVPEEDVDAFRAKFGATQTLGEGAAAQPLPATPENIAAAKSFVFGKWRERAKELGRADPIDLSDACKFTSLFAATVFGGTMHGNFFHQWVHLPDGRTLDLNDEAADVITMLRGEIPDDAKPYAAEMRKKLPQSLYTADDRHMRSRGNRQSMASVRPRVQRWADEFLRHRMLGEARDMKTYRVAWGRNQHAHLGTETVKALSERDARRQVRQSLDDRYFSGHGMKILYVTEVNQNGTETLGEGAVAIPDCVGPCLYHATFERYLPAIMQHGLGATTKRQNFDVSRQGRVYLTNHPNVAENYAKEASGHGDDDIVVLLVDQRQLDPALLHADENDTGVMLDMQYDDDDGPSLWDDDKEYDHTYISYEYHGVIPPSALSVSHTI